MEKTHDVAPAVVEEEPGEVAELERVVEGAVVGDVVGAVVPLAEGVVPEVLGAVAPPVLPDTVAV